MTSLSNSDSNFIIGVKDDRFQKAASSFTNKPRNSINTKRMLPFEVSTIRMKVFQGRRQYIHSNNTRVRATKAVIQQPRSIGDCCNLEDSRSAGGYYPSSSANTILTNASTCTELEIEQQQQDPLLPHNDNNASDREGDIADIKKKVDALNISGLLPSLVPPIPLQLLLHRSTAINTKPLTVHSKYGLSSFHQVSNDSVRVPVPTRPSIAKDCNVKRRVGNRHNKIRWIDSSTYRNNSIMSTTTTQCNNDKARTMSIDTVDKISSIMRESIDKLEDLTVNKYGHGTHVNAMPMDMIDVCLLALEGISTLLHNKDIKDLIQQALEIFKYYIFDTDDEDGMESSRMKQIKDAREDSINKLFMPIHRGSAYDNNNNSLMESDRDDEDEIFGDEYASSDDGQGSLFTFTETNNIAKKHYNIVGGDDDDDRSFHSSDGDSMSISYDSLGENEDGATSDSDGDDDKTIKKIQALYSNQSMRKETALSVSSYIYTLVPSLWLYLLH